MNAGSVMLIQMLTMKEQCLTRTKSHIHIVITMNQADSMEAADGRKEDANQDGEDKEEGEYEKNEDGGQDGKEYEEDKDWEDKEVDDFDP